MTPDEARRAWYREMAERLTPVYVQADDVVQLWPPTIRDPFEAARLSAHFGRLALLQTYTSEVPVEVSDEWAQDCYRWRGRVLVGEYRHWCMEWDDLPVDETCGEWPCGCAAIEERLRGEASRIPEFPQ